PIGEVLVFMARAVAARSLVANSPPSHGPGDRRRDSVCSETSAHACEGRFARRHGHPGGRWRRQRRGHSAGCGRSGPVRDALRTGRPGRAYFQRQHKTDPWWLALSGAVRVPAGGQGAGGARGDPAPGTPYQLADDVRVATRITSSPSMDDPAWLALV